MKEALFELVKRDGRREAYDPAKLARSLLQAGVAPYMLAGIMDAVDPRPGMDTNSRYASVRRLIVSGSEQAGHGWICLHPESSYRLGLRPNDTIWLSNEGTPAPFSVECLEDVGRGQAWLNPREMAAMEVRDGTKMAASSVYHQKSASPKEPQGISRATATMGWALNATAGHG
jgi:hypothetical protein